MPKVFVTGSFKLGAGNSQPISHVNQRPVWASNTESWGTMKFTKSVLSNWSRKAALGAAAGALLSATLVAAPAQAANGGYCSKQVINLAADGTYYAVPADSNFNVLCRLDQGANSVAVKALQAGLNGRCAVSAGLAVDGAFGPATRAALVRAQQKFGVTADGIYGPNTARVFKWTSGKGNCYSSGA
ncbi:MAG: peptidoglycan-binding protein [Renibacterium salmoninarum]|nr:peptidoglycan-binding protein [Renibacterium salmoninarum]